MVQSRFVTRAFFNFTFSLFPLFAAIIFALSSHWKKSCECLFNAFLLLSCGIKTCGAILQISHDSPALRRATVALENITMATAFAFYCQLSFSRIAQTDAKINVFAVVFFWLRNFMMLFSAVFCEGQEYKQKLELGASVFYAMGALALTNAQLLAANTTSTANENKEMLKLFAGLSFLVNGIYEGCASGIPAFGEEPDDADEPLINDQSSFSFRALRA